MVYTCIVSTQILLGFGYAPQGGDEACSAVLCSFWGTEGTFAS